MKRAPRPATRRRYPILDTTCPPFERFVMKIFGLGLPELLIANARTVALFIGGAIAGIVLWMRAKRGANPYSCGTACHGNSSRRGRHDIRADRHPFALVMGLAAIAASRAHKKITGTQGNNASTAGLILGMVENAICVIGLGRTGIISCFSPREADAARSKPPCRKAPLCRFDARPGAAQPESPGLLRHRDVSRRLPGPRSSTPTRKRPTLDTREHHAETPYPRQRQPRQCRRGRKRRHRTRRADRLRHLQTRLLRTLRRGGLQPAKLDAILITHEHGNHAKGLGVVMRGLAKVGQHAVYAAVETLRASKPLQEADEACAVRALAPDRLVSAAGLSVFPFPTSHDAAASFGFRIEANGDAAGFMTDTGIVGSEAHAHLENVRLLALESNHDERMLREGPYPYAIKQRIASDRGHLSNAQAPRAGRASERPSRNGGGHAYIGEQQRIRPGEARPARRPCARRPSGARRMRLPRTPDHARLSAQYAGNAHHRRRVAMATARRTASRYAGFAR